MRRWEPVVFWRRGFGEGFDDDDLRFRVRERDFFCFFWLCFLSRLRLSLRNLLLREESPPEFGLREVFLFGGRDEEELEADDEEDCSLLLSSSLRRMAFSFCLRDELDWEDAGDGDEACWLASRPSFFWISARRRCLMRSLSADDCGASDDEAVGGEPVRRGRSDCWGRGWSGSWG